MRNLWLVAKHEYLKLVKQKSFLISTLSMPILIVFISVISVFVALGQRGKLPVGYVDHAGVLSAGLVLEQGNRRSPPVTMRAFSDEAEARELLEAGDLQALYVLAEDYAQSGKLELLYIKKRPGEVVLEDFQDFMRLNLLANLPAEVQQRVLAGPRTTVRSIDGSREFAEDNIMDFILPFVAAFFFFFAVMNAAGYMLQAVTDEKENRTIEILATSLRPLELIGGKALGLMCVSLTQLLIWAITAIVGIAVAASFFVQMRGFSIPWPLIVVVVLFFFPAYALITGMMTVIGSIVTDLRQGQQISGILNMLFTMPFFFVTMILAKPNSPFVVALSLFPTTAFVTTVMRWPMTEIPLWQLLVSWSLLVTSSLLCVWVAARIFRVGMLSYGQRLSLRHIFAALRGSER